MNEENHPDPLEISDLDLSHLWRPLRKKRKKKSKQIKSKISFTPKAAKVIRSERGLAGPPTASDVTQVISWSLGYFAR